MDNYSLIWFVIGIFFLLAELVLPGFIIFFFGIGGLFTSLVTYLFKIESIVVQIIIFISSSLLSLILLRNFFSSLFKGKVSSSNKLQDEFVGRRALVIKEIKPNSLPGKIEINGTYWKADSEFYIEKDSIVEITGRKDLTLIVKPVD